MCYSIIMPNKVCYENGAGFIYYPMIETARNFYSIRKERSSGTIITKWLLRKL